MMEGEGDLAGAGALSSGDARVPDGLKYHVCDVWVDGLVSVEGWEGGIRRGIMTPLESLAKKGSTKIVRFRATNALRDGRLCDTNDGEQDMAESSEASDGSQFEGFDD